MAKRLIPITFLALALGFPADHLRASDEPVVDKVIELQDEGDEDVVFDLDAPEGPEAPEPPERPGKWEKTVVRIDRDGRRGYLGIQLIEMTPELREHFGAPRDAGVLVGGVEKDSPAAKAGVQVGDIVTAADGERIESTHDLSHAVRARKAGETVKLDLSRDRAKKQLTVTVAERPAREIRVGELAPKMRSRAYVLRGLDSLGHLDGLAPFQDLGRVQERLNDLEKRLKDLEKKLPAR